GAPLAFPLRRGAYRAKRSRHRRIHGSCQQSHDPPRDCSRARSCHLEDLRRLLVLLGRPTLEDLRQDLRAVLKKCRPDWDITTPELKAAWRQGRKELFYPYGKTYAQTLGEQD